MDIIKFAMENFSDLATVCRYFPLYCIMLGFEMVKAGSANQYGNNSCFLWLSVLVELAKLSNISANIPSWC